MTLSPDSQCVMSTVLITRALSHNVSSLSAAMIAARLLGLRHPGAVPGACWPGPAAGPQHLKQQHLKLLSQQKHNCRQLGQLSTTAALAAGGGN